MVAPSPSVLVVDDDADLRQLICLMLEDAGMQVVQAANGKDALDAVKRRRPDVVLLDLMMPIMDGWAFCRALHEYDDVPPIVIMTAAEEPPDEAKQLGAAAWLTKPFDIDRLIACVRRSVEVAREA